MKLIDEEKIGLIKNKLISLIRHSTEDRARLHSHNNEFTLSAPGRDFKPGQVLGNWMSMILVSGEALRIIYKLHYNLSEVKAIAYRTYGKDTPEQLSDKQAMDFMKELCNLSAGQMIKIFDENQLPLGMSLPLCARGFYEIFADYTLANKPFIKFGDLWSLKCGDMDIMLSCVIEILDASALVTILNYEIPVNAKNDDGEMDFL